MKVFFAPIPRSVYPDKPQSMIDIYTGIAAPSFRSIGGSLPVTIPAELYSNFGFFGLLLIVPLFRVLDNFFLRAIVGIRTHPWSMKVHLGIFLTATSIMMIRGSGIELYAIYALVSLPLVVSLLFVSSTNAKRH